MPRLSVLTAALALAACATPSVRPAEPAAASRPAPLLCEHHVPADACVRCHPGLADAFKARGDWCPEHARPETQCLECHPALTFVELPPLRDGADLRFLSTMGEDVPVLEPHAVPGKVTVFDFYAPWCAACRDVDAWAYDLLNRRDDVALRKLNAMSWESPLARRWLGSVSTLPFVVVFGKDGRRVREVSGLDLAALEAAVAEGAAR